MQTPLAGTTPNMVAVTDAEKPGPVTHWPSSQGFGPLVTIGVQWSPRVGRDQQYARWDDALGDALALLKLKRDCLHEQPPVKPVGTALSADSFNLWVAAVLQFQTEGTAIFDAVRPSLDLSGPHENQDLRRIQQWKRDGVKDGRQLVRWALSFVDRSTIVGQMKLVKDINEMKLSASESLFGLSEHLHKLWELWLALSSSDRAQPNSFFSILLISMPTEPEGPVVHVRRFLLDLLDRDDSPLLADIDGDNGLFAKMLKYGASLGLRDQPLAALHYQGPRAGDTPAGGGQTQDQPGTTPRGQVKNDNPCCNSFACTAITRGSHGCICKHNSKFNVSTIASQARREYIKLLRVYSKANPSKSLKVNIRVVREAVGEQKPDNGKGPNLSFMASVESVLGNNVTNVDELDAWLSDHNGDGSFFALGATEGEGNLQFVVEEVCEPVDDHLNAMGASSGSSATLGSSTHSNTEAETVASQLRLALEEANARIQLLETVSEQPVINAAATETPRWTFPPSRVENTPLAPNPSLDPPTPLSAVGQMTPKVVYAKLRSTWQSAPSSTPASAMRRQPQFTPRTDSIAEENDAPSGGGKKQNATELLGRSIVAVESEKRKFKDKLEKQKASKFWLIRSIATLALTGGGCIHSLASVVTEYCSELTLHQLMTLSLLIYSSHGKVTPMIKLLVSKLSNMMVNASVAQARSLLEQVRGAMTSLLCAVLAKAALTTTKMCRPFAALSTSTTPSAVPATHADLTPSSDSGIGELNMMRTQLGNSILLASMELTGTDGIVPALMDNGASSGTSCTRSLEGAVAGTFNASDAGDIGLGSEGAVLKSKGSWLFVLHRHGTNSSELVVRRMKYTPNLPMAMVFSEACENGVHGYNIVWKAGEGRLMESPSGVVIKLHMSKSNLGYLKVKPVTDTTLQNEAIARMHEGATMLVMDPSQVRTVGMGKVKPLKGVALVRRRHCIDGHPALTVTVKNLRLEGAFDKGLVTLADVKLFAEQGCGACETAKMRRRPFTPKIEALDSTEPKLGKLLVFDVLELRTPSAHNGATLVYVAIEKVSKYALAGVMHGYSEEHMISALNEIKARVRPVHGEIEIMRMDSHPTHRGKGVRDYMTANQHRMQISPGYVHEGVGDAENFFLHNVPSANAVLLSAPDLGENHWAQAFFYVVRAKNYSINVKASSQGTPASPAMVYFNTKQYLGSGLQVFGSESKALVHGEARGSKFEDHARPCIYVGPAVNSDSSVHCAVFYDKNYVDVDLGCVSVSENQVIERTRRGNVTTQPYNQVGGAKTVDIGMPTSLFDLTGMEYAEKDLPKCRPIVWVRGMMMPTEFMVLLLYHGDLRAGDMSSWVYELSATKVVPLPIDLKVGGQEHNLERRPIKLELLEAFKRENVLGAFLQAECGPYTAARYVQPGPPVLFDMDNVDGIPDADGEYPPEVLKALNAVSFVADVFRASAGTDKAVGLEYPASQAAHSPFAAKGREKHSTIADTSIMRAVTSELNLVVVYTEQGAMGAASRKPTSILATAEFAKGLMRTVGTLAMPAGSLADAKLTGTDSNGNYKSRKSEVYTPAFALRLTIAFLGSMTRLLADLAVHDIAIAEKVSVDDIYPIGTRLEVYWYLDKAWYKGVVVDTCVRKGKVHSKSIDRREVRVRYESDGVELWHAICDYNMRECDDEDHDDENSMAVLAMLRERRVVSLSDKKDFLSSIYMLEESEGCRRQVPPPPPPPRKLTPMFILRKFDKPAEEFKMQLMTQCASADECAERIAYFLLGMERIKTKYEKPCDETAACNAEPRVDELVQQLKLFTVHGPTLVHNACKAEVAKCGHSVEDMRMMRHEHRRDGRCNECRDRYESGGLHPCLICGQTLCDACLPQGYHGWCVAVPSRSSVWDAAFASKSDEHKLHQMYSEVVKSGVQSSHVDLKADDEPRPPGPPESIVPKYCSNCGEEGDLCEEPHCMRGPCCQPNESCARCHTQATNDTYNLNPRLFRRAMRESKLDTLRGDTWVHELNAHVGEVFVARDVQIDMEDMSMVESSAVFVVLDGATVQRVDTAHAHKWHVPANEREYNMSPQRALWRTAKELKMDDYARIHMFDLVLKRSVDLKVHTIYRTLWAYKVKFKEAGLIFDKLNPRWCVKGGTMDRDMFKSYAEMMRHASLNVLLGIKAEFYHELADALIDLKDAFQSTGTVEPSGELKEGEHEFYTEQAPGFKKYGPNGEELVCRQRCYMQGRIDATAGFDRRLMSIMTKSAHFTPLMWDAKVLEYHITEHAGTTATLRKIVEEGNAIVAENRDSKPQQPPLGWAVFGQHVDDAMALATGKLNRKENRIFNFVVGEIAVVYACKLTGWHGNKMLGFDLVLDDKLATVTVTAQGALETIREKLFTKDCFKTTPRHIVTEAVYEDSPGEVPVEGDPMRNEYMARQAITRSCLGGGIWIALAYPQVASGINSMCMNMANPSDARLGQVRHMFMYLGEKPPGKTFGGANVTSIMSEEEEVKPFTAGKKEGRYHFFSDASINVTGGVGMFAGACIQMLALRQHLQAPDAHTSEIVAGGTNVHAIIPVNGVLQELHIRRGRATKVYFDSQSTVFCATSDAAPKKSVWLGRRIKVITETVEHGEIAPEHMPESDMAADSCTKYIKHNVWARHMHYVLNLPGDPPECHDLINGEWTKIGPKGKAKA